MSVKVIEGDCREVLPTLPDSSVQCCVSSPPYYQLRDYQVAGQIGLEASVEEYVGELVAVFAKVRRALRPDGTLWLNLASSYASDSKWGGATGGKHVKALHGDTGIGRGRRRTGYKDKDLIPIPWLVGLALQQDGWWLRRDHIWHKPNCMPESATDRATSAHEYVLLLTKSARYFYDAEAVKEEAVIGYRHNPNSTPKSGRKAASSGMWRNAATATEPIERGHDQTGATYDSGSGRTMRSVWTIPCAPFPLAHFATFPPALAERCVKAGTSEKGACPACGSPWVRVVERSTRFEGGSGRAGRTAEDVNANGKWAGKQYGTNIKLGPVVDSETTGWQPTCACPPHDPVPCCVLDPFAGAGTTALVADRLGRDAILIELNSDYCDLIRRRITNDAPLFADLR